MRIKFWLLFLFCVSNMALNSQNDETTATFNSAAHALKNGGLIVLLPTQSRSIEAIEETLANGDLSTKGRQRLEERLFFTKSATLNAQNGLITFFNEYYTASNLYFIYDTDWPTLKSGNISGYFLDNDLSVDPNIIRSSEDYLILRKGHPNPAYYRVREALILYDSSGEELPLVFPSVHALITPFWQIGVTKELADFARYKKTIKKLSQRLQYLVDNLED